MLRKYVTIYLRGGELPNEANVLVHIEDENYENILEFLTE